MNNMKNPIYLFASYCIVIAVTLILKLTGIIAWSWWWITAPIWIPFLIAVILVIAFFWLVGYYSKLSDELNDY